VNLDRGRLIDMRLVVLACFLASVAGAQSAPGPKNIPTDHDYYYQVYQKGAFYENRKATTPEGFVTGFTKALTEDYACFNDDSRSGLFFTFIAWAYDERYGAADDKLTESSLDLGIHTNRTQKQWDTMQAIQQSAPYVRFMPSSLLDAYPPDQQQFFRGGGRILTASIYEKAIKVADLLFHADRSNSWLVSISAPDSNGRTRTNRILQLSIDRTTMRYVESIAPAPAAKGRFTPISLDYRVPQTGICEKIRDPK
jgi:hypothetical protein